MQKKAIFNKVTRLKSQTPCQGQGVVHSHCNIFMFPRLLLSKRQWCMMGMQSAGPLRTLALHRGAFFDVCCSKQEQISPFHHLLRDEAQHKSVNEHIRRKPRKENVTVVNGIVSCVVCTRDARSAGLRPSFTCADGTPSHWRDLIWNWQGFHL